MLSTAVTQTPVAALWASIPSPSFQELKVGPFAFRLYGLMIALGVLAAVWIARKRWSSYGGDPEDVTTIALVAVPAGLIGARLYHVITDWNSLYSGGRWWPDAFMIWKGGLGIPGGVLLGAVAGVLVARYLQLDWRRVGDAAAPAIPVAQAIGRLGNWFNQELFGRPTDLPWGLRIDPVHRPDGYRQFDTFQPTFLYEGLWNLGLAGLIIWGSSKVVLKPGRWFAVYVLGYGLGRLWVESLRIDDATRLLGIRVNLWTSGIAILGGLLWLFWRGSPVDHDGTARLRAGESLATIAGVVPSPRSHPADAATDDGPADAATDDGPADAATDDAPDVLATEATEDVLDDDAAAGDADDGAQEK